MGVWNQQGPVDQTLLCKGHMAYPHPQPLCCFMCHVCQISWLPAFLHLEMEENRKNEESIHSFGLLLRLMFPMYVEGQAIIWASSQGVNSEMCLPKSLATVAQASYVLLFLWFFIIIPCLWLPGFLCNPLRDDVPRRHKCRLCKGNF